MGAVSHWRTVRACRQDMKDTQSVPGKEWSDGWQNWPSTRLLNEGE
jgi:hypothetical protein